MVVPGPPSFLADGMMALPPLTTARNGAPAEQVAQLLAGLDQLLQVLHEAARERVLDHRHRRHLAQRLLEPAAAVLLDLLDHRHQLADLHQCPPAAGPCPLTTSAARVAGGVLRLRPILICPSMRIMDTPKRSPTCSASSAVRPWEPIGASTMQRSASRPGAITPVGSL